ncbi:MAG TPA: wax ester/triacylglycerol synthase family O-acyltransferase [Myxococcota bacterium]|jgi:WS/DGAT/MGAT family acyltransferase
MSARDAGFLYLERSHTQLHIGCVAIFEGALRREDVIERIEERLPRLRRYAQRAMRVPFSLGHPSWEDDPEFRVEDHVTRWGLPSPGGENELREAVAHLFALPLDRGRPLWEMHLLEGLADGRTALFQKVHHCMIDGMAGAQLLETLLDREPDPAPRAAGVTHRESELPDARRRFARALGEEIATRARGALSTWRAVTRPRAASEAIARLKTAAYSALQLATSELETLPWNQPLGPRRAVAFTRLPMSGVRSIRHRHGGSVNDVVLSTLAGGLKRWLEAHGQETRGLELRALVPVSLRSPDQAAELGNRISAMLVPLAVDPAGEVPRLVATQAATQRLKKTGAWTGIDALLELVDGLPAALVASVGQRLSLGRLANVISTNVPGPTETRWLCGARALELRPLVPIADGLGLGLAVFSYDGWLQIGLSADADLVPDLEKLEQALGEAFASLLGSAIGGARA